ncbi:MAG TPA: universal stress protein [Anaerolineae bacterium]|nr:universal stress protein [Anaerolineae bacterium]
MFTHLLVPLDGSTLAEMALPAAVFLARLTSARVTLLHLIERHPPEEVHHHDRHLTNAAEATAYLEEVRQRAFGEISVECHVHTTEIDDVASSIVEHINELAPDLIVMCTHGQGGWRRRLFGSKAQQVIALNKTPMLLIPPAPEAKAEFQLKRIVVPLDGNAEHEQGLQVAIDLARACQAALHLVYVIPTVDRLKGDDLATGRLLPHTMAAILDMQQEEATEYLGCHIADLREAGMTVSAEVARGEVAKTILETAKQQLADLIALGTHAKSGMDAIWSGSLTPVISDRSPAPLLLVPIQSTSQV